MGRSAIRALDRKWIFEVLLWPRDEKGQPVFPNEQPAGDYLRDLAGKRGLTGEQARAWASRMRRSKGSRKKKRKGK